MPETIPDAAAVEAWLVAKLAEELRLDPDQVDPEDAFNDYGLDSLSAASISDDLCQWLQLELSPSLLWDYPTIRSLTAFILERLEAQAS